ncbi:MAG: hypothetical protein SGILL_009475 [Bacillariaceae sp.]
MSTAHLSSSSSGESGTRMEEKDSNNSEVNNVVVDGSNDVVAPPLSPQHPNNNRMKKPRQYLVDRAKGTSKLDPTSRPPCFMCWVPMPVVWLADYIETNRVFDALGKFGCFSPDNLRARRACLGIGLACNLIAFVLQLYVCFATSWNSQLIMASSFTKGFIQPSSYLTDYPWAHNLDMGIRAVVEQRKLTADGSYRDDYLSVFSYDEFCDLPQVEVVFQEGECDKCLAVSKSITATLFISLIMYIPSITTDVLRMYPHYDVNCQKIFGGFAAVISLAFAFYTFVVYQFRCFRNMGFGSICLSPGCSDAFGISEVCEVIDPGPGNSCASGFIQVQRNFWAGPGWIALATASGLKIFDMFMNIAIPTPSICRNLEEQQAYEDKYGEDAAPSKDVVVEEEEEEQSL